MTGSRIRVHTDEDVDRQLAGDLRTLGYDAVSSHESGNSNQKHTDDWQLRHATRERRSILVHNIDDYARLAKTWAESGREHWDIIAVKKTTPYGELVRRICAHIDSVEPEYQRNMMLFLP